MFVLQQSYFGVVSHLITWPLNAAALFDVSVATYVCGMSARKVCNLIRFNTNHLFSLNLVIECNKHTTETLIYLIHACSYSHTHAHICYTRVATHPHMHTLDTRIQLPTHTRTHLLHTRSNSPIHAHTDCQPFIYAILTQAMTQLHSCVSWAMTRRYTEHKTV